MITYITLIRVFKKKSDDSKYDYYSSRLESMPDSSYDGWFDRHRTGKLDEGFDVFKSNKSMDRQGLEELKQSLSEIYQQNKDNAYQLNIKFEDWINENFTQIEFENE